MSNNLTKAELVSVVAGKTGSTKSSVESVLSGIIEAVQEALTDGKNVTLIGFGTFSVADRKAREGRNPSTGEKIKIAASKAVKFKSGKQLKEAVNK